MCRTFLLFLLISLNLAHLTFAISKHRDIEERTRQPWTSDHDHDRDHHRINDTNHPMTQQVDSTTTNLKHISEKLRMNLNRKFDTTILFAANDEATLFIDGKPVAMIRDKMRHGYYRGLLRLGTTIGVEASNRIGWGGVVITVRAFGQNFGTGHGNFFKAHAQYSYGPKRILWRFKHFPTCEWGFPRRVYLPRSLRRKERSWTFPFFLGGRYVWASGVSRHGTVLLRGMLGGERCTIKASPTMSATPSPIAEIFRQCGCRQMEDERRGDCYEFTEKRRSGVLRRRCEKKTCENRFECVESGATNRCMGRVVRSEVMMIGMRVSGQLFCVLARLRKTRVMMVPYA